MKPRESLRTRMAAADPVAQAPAGAHPQPGTERIEIPRQDGKTREQMLTELTLSTIGRNALSAQGFAGRGFGDAADYQESMVVIARMCGEVRRGSLDGLTDMLTSQALVLDTMFSEYSRLALQNMGHYPDAVDR